MVIENIDQKRLDELLKEGETFLLDFYDEDCLPCKVMEPRLDAVADESEGRVGVHRLDVKANPDVPGHYGIKSIPTVLLFRDGEEAGRLDGLIREKELREKFAELATAR